MRERFGRDGFEVDVDRPFGSGERTGAFDEVAARVRRCVAEGLVACGGE